MYLYRPLWVYAVRGWATLLFATVSVAAILTSFIGAVGLLNTTAAIEGLVLAALVLSFALWAYLWTITEREC